MTADLDFACTCGEITGTLIAPTPKNGARVVCHCTDCQNFARHLGMADRVLDAQGGTDLYSARCAAMQLTKGAEKLACLHLTDKPTLRWYATCCRTPMFNSYANGRMPYLTTFVANCDAAQAQATLGPVTGHLSLPKSAGELTDAPRMSFAKLMRGAFVRMVRDILSGDRRRSALFDAQTLEPICPPHRWSATEQAAVADSPLLH